MKLKNQFIVAAASVAIAMSAHAQFQGPSTGSTPYILPTAAGWSTTSILTVDNTGSNPDDTVPKVGGGNYQMNGIPDGLGAYDNGNGTFTVLMHHEMGDTVGITRAHGAKGAYISEFVVDKNTLAVTSGQDLIKNVYGWNATTQTSNAFTSTVAFNRLCSADLAAASAYTYTDTNTNTVYGTSERIFMGGDESGSNGYAIGTVATGANKGNTYILGKMNLSTNGSGLTGVGGWENNVANPLSQLKTVVVGTNDGGTGIMSNSVSVYVGTKTTTGSEVDKAGLTNGTLKFVNVTGNAAEVVNGTTRATNITSGTAFTLSSTASTTFSRPEDGAWNPLNPSQFYFATTDRIDQVSDGLGAQIGQTRLWRLNFADISNPDLGGTIDLLLDGATVGGIKTNMFDNLTVNETTGKILLQEDVGSTVHNGKVWEFDPSVGISSLKQILKHDPARFGDRVAGVTTNATSPYTVDEEGSGIIDITGLMAGSALNTGTPGEAWYLSSDQAHYATGISTEQVEGGQLVAIHAVPEASTVTTYALVVAGAGAYFVSKRRRRNA